MYYFKVPVFTKLSRIQNIIILFLQLIILIISILISLYRGCNYESIKFMDGCIEYSILPGNIMVTNETFSSWQFFTPVKYSSEIITNLYNIKYDNVLSTTLNGYILLKGSIFLSNTENKDYDAIFKEFSKPVYYYDFIYHFNNSVEMNNETYIIDIKEGLLELMFLNNCSNSSVLTEIDNICFINDNAYNNVNEFLKVYFSEEFISPYSCYNCYTNGIKSLNEAITVLSKCISIFVMFNSFIIIIYMFVISKIKKEDIGYIESVINEENIIGYKFFENNNIDEIIKK